MTKLWFPRSAWDLYEETNKEDEQRASNNKTEKYKTANRYPDLLKNHRRQLLVCGQNQPYTAHG